MCEISNPTQPKKTNYNLAKNNKTINSARKWQLFIIFAL